MAFIFDVTSGSASLQFNTGVWTISNAVTLSDNIGVSTTVDGIISGAFSLTKTGASTLTLGGTNTYSGGTMVSAGTLLGTTSSLQGNITNNAAVTINQGGLTTITTVISGTESVTYQNTSNLTLSSASTYTGGTFINGVGKLVIASDNRLGNAAGTLTFNGGDLKTSASITSSRNITLNAGGGSISTGSNNPTFSGVISGVGALSKSGSGLMTLSGTNTYSGGTNITVGTLRGTTDSLQGNMLMPLPSSSTRRRREPMLALSAASVPSLNWGPVL